MKETLKISDRFNLIKKLGQGTFSFIYEAQDKKLQKNVALKIEKKDKNKSILVFEYSVLNALKGLSHVCNVYDFVKNSEQNLIVMDLLGNNLAKVRKCLEENYNLKIAIQLLIEMLDAIEEVHQRGFIHRDVKASNFVLSQDNRHVYIVDFGLAKKHLDDNSNPVHQRKKADFRGTVSFASLNAHNNIDLARRDDIWSLYFVILDFLNEKLKWREQKEYTMDEVKNIKTECLSNPEEKLWIVTKDIPEVKLIFNHIQSLGYKDKPNYSYIKLQLQSIYARSIEVSQRVCTTQQQLQRFGQVAQQIFLQHPQAQGNAINMIQGQPGLSQKVGQQLPSPQTGVEFQTPERPPNHQRCLHAISTTLNQSVPNDDGAFPRASPDSMSARSGLNQQAQPQLNYPHFFVQNMPKKQQIIPLENKNNQPPNLNPVQTIGVKRKAVDPLSQESLRAATNTSTSNGRQGIDDHQLFSSEQEKLQVYGQIQTGLEKQGKVNARKREVKKKNVNVIQDEKAMFQTPRQGDEGHQQPQLNGTSNGLLYQFTPGNGNYVNQHININQNFFLSPSFVLFYNDQKDNQPQPGQEHFAPFTNGQGQVQQNPNMLSQNHFIAPPLEGHQLPPQCMLNTNSTASGFMPNKLQQQPLFQQNSMFDSLGRPANTHPFFTGANEDKIRSGLKPQGPFVTTPRQKEGEQKPFLVTKEIAQGRTNSTGNKPYYSYNPNLIETNKGHIFKVEKDKDQFQKVYKSNKDEVSQKFTQRQDQLLCQKSSAPGLGLVAQTQMPAFVSDGQHVIPKL